MRKTERFVIPDCEIKREIEVGEVKIRNIIEKGKEILDITRAQIAKAKELSAKGGEINFDELSFVKHAFSLFLPLCTNITYEEMISLYPSELLLVLTAFVRINKDFLPTLALMGYRFPALEALLSQENKAK